MSIDFYPEIGQVRDKDGLFRPFPGFAPNSDYLDLFLPGINTTLQFEAWWGQTIHRYDSTYKHLEGWFSIMAKAWRNKKYTLKYYKPDVSSASEMFPEDDLADKEPAQLCTDATIPVEDWADNDPMTWYVRANALSLADGTMNILAVEGVDDEFDLSGEIAPVWTFCLALWKKEWDDGDYTYKSWATKQFPGYEPYAGDVDPTTNQKRVMTWRPTFPGSLTNDGTKLTSGAGKKPYILASPSVGLTKARAMDAYEGLWNDADTIWVLDMWQLRHFNLENSDICNGCQSYYFSHTVAVAETGVTRVILTMEKAAKFPIGSNVSIGTARTNNIRMVLSKEEIEVEGTTYVALNLNGEAFDTETSYEVFTMPWNSGDTENLPDHKDGACYSLTAGRNPMRVQGVEIMSGAFDIGLDPLYDVTNFVDGNGGDYTVYECRNSENLSDSITVNYENTGIVFEQLPPDWSYPKKFVRTSKAVLFPEVLGGSSSSYFKSGIGGASYNGVRCPWRFGASHYGITGGLACESVYHTPFNTQWYGRPRLSGSGKKRGVWTGGGA